MKQMKICLNYFLANEKRTFKVKELSVHLREGFEMHQNDFSPFFLLINKLQEKYDFHLLMFCEVVYVISILRATASCYFPFESWNIYCKKNLSIIL